MNGRTLSCGPINGQMCYEECISKGALYMGLIGGNKCSCGEDADYVDSDKTDGKCDVTCAGEDSICGGMDSFDLYEFIETTTETEITDGGFPNRSALRINRSDIVG